MNTIDHLQLKQEIKAIQSNVYWDEWSHIGGKNSFCFEKFTINYGELL